MKKSCLVLLICGLMSASAACQERTRPLIPKDEGVAFRKSLLMTVIPATVGGGLVLWGAGGNSNAGLIVAGAALGGFGLLLGPSTGHIYAGRPHPVSGMGLRILVGVVGGAGTLVVSIGESISGTDFSGTAAIAGVSGAVIMGSVIYDIATAGRSAERYNKKHGLASWHVQPQYFAQQEAMGLKLTVSF